MATRCIWPPESWLGRLFTCVGEAHAREGVQRAASALGAAHAREREREFHVGEDRLVRDEVVALEHEADAVVAVGVPVAVLVLAGGDAVDHEVAVVEVVEAAHDVEHGGLAGAGRAEHRDELAVTEGNGDVVERHLRESGS